MESNKTERERLSDFGDGNRGGLGGGGLAVGGGLCCSGSKKRGNAAPV